MPPGKLGGGWFFLKVKDREIVVGVGIRWVEFDGAAQFVLSAFDPTSAAHHNPEKIVCPGVPWVLEHGLGKCSQCGIRLIAVHIDHAEREPGWSRLEAL